MRKGKDGALKETLLYTDLNSTLQCNICQRRCKIPEGKKGFCQSRQNTSGILASLIYAKVSVLEVVPIENKPVYHFYPKSRWLSVGSLGCNFKCPGCQNWEISCDCAEDIAAKVQTIKPDELVNLALTERCDGISFTYNEPAIWLEYTLDAARLAKRHNLYTNYVTNASLTLEALALIAPYLDVFRADLKGFSADTYKRLADFENFSGILEVITAAKNKYKMHVEVATNIILGYNDDSLELANLAQWIKAELGEDTPWHITQFLPQYKLRHLLPTPLEVLEEVARMGVSCGLKFVYIGNIPEHPLANTYCPNCHAVLIRRNRFATQELNISDGSCAKCGAKIAGRFKC